jgi:hypothetical protein
MSPKKKGVVKVTKRNVLRSLKDRYDDFCEAVTLAESGMLNEAQRLVSNRKPRKILVLGVNGLFSRAVVDYALEFAKRMSYEIVALNIVGSLSSPPAPSVNADIFSAEAQARGISFYCVSRNGRLEECLKSVEREIGAVELMISDPVFCSEVDCTELGSLLPLITVAMDFS